MGRGKQGSNIIGCKTRKAERLAASFESLDGEFICYRLLYRCIAPGYRMWSTRLTGRPVTNSCLGNDRNLPLSSTVHHR